MPLKLRSLGHIQGVCRWNTAGNDENDRELIPEVAVRCTAERLLTAPAGVSRELPQKRGCSMAPTSIFNAAGWRRGGWPDRQA
jgi:hypothetical protein